MLPDVVYAGGLQVGHVMTRAVLAVPPDLTAREAERRARVAGVSHLPVVNLGELYGVVCLCDMHHGHEGDRVISRINRPPHTVRESAPIEVAARIMSERDLGCLPVVRRTGTLVGMLTRSDLRRVGALPGVCPPSCESCGNTHHVTRAEDGRNLCVRCRESIGSGR